MSIKENLQQIRNTIPENVTLVAVSKTKPIEDIELAYQEGQRHFGENKAQELQGKQPELPTDIKWHMIGHLQRNKVKYIAPFVHLIHAVDSFKLLKEINKQAKNNNRTIHVLLQFHIAKEESKFGYTMERFEEEWKNNDPKALENIFIDGVMGMATFTDNMDMVREEFRRLKTIFEKLHQSYFTDSSFSQISMGMSQDYEIAIEEGSTMVRVGSSIFGARN
ncbi:MAG: YggS family pyridoxal phosphate-dependent enzyme [Salinivirgaceae bacterium]|jgi:pyridoxal phosphate enzyme (YggS family)|nr:YggS family pyridoxal phosphate-dependent enzyme [Salinivirgaceae bacterium]